MEDQKMKAISEIVKIIEVWLKAWDILLKPIIETILILQKQVLPTHLNKLERG